jgi:uncharacterized tellurite resistance protein B-like protein
MQSAATVLDSRQRHTAFAVATEIMRSDGPLEERERQILANLATNLDLAPEDIEPVLAVMDVLHASLLTQAPSINT